MRKKHLVVFLQGMATALGKNSELPIVGKGGAKLLLSLARRKSGCVLIEVLW